MDALLLPNFFQALKRALDPNIASTELIAEAVECVRRLSFGSGNEVILEDMSEFLVSPLIEATVARGVETREGALEVLMVLTERKESVQAQVGAVRHCIKRLVALLAGGLVSRIEQKIAKFAACVLSNISLVPANKPKLLPYEVELAMVAASNSGVAKVVCEVLHEISEFQVFRQ